MGKFFHHFDTELFHERSLAFDVWHVFGIVLFLILLCAIIGFVINCVRNRGAFGGVYGQPGVVGGVQTYGSPQYY